MANHVYIGVGSNHQAQANIQNGLRRLSALVRLIAVSPVYETAAVGGGAPYWNAAIHIETTLTPDALKQELAAIEDAVGRVRRDPDGTKSQVVALDFDILLYNDEQRSYGKREIPHPDVLQYAHVAAPLADIAAERQHPTTGERLRDIAALLSNGVAMQQRNDVTFDLG